MKPQRFLAWLLVAAVSSAVWSAYLFASRTTRTFTAATDYAALAVAIGVGIAGVFLLIRASRERAVAAGLYVLLAGGGMYTSLAILCAAGECR